MTIRVGAIVGVFEIIGLEGAGGMGEVYRARDARLGRDVALKLLPERFHADADRLARFAREAQLLASLNHPNIATLYGIEDLEGRQAIVLEWVDGETLAERIARGPVPLDTALQLARQIADGLEAAHERAVIHRDLKPGNIKVRRDGTVKILDFGLAKALDPTEGAPRDAATMTAPATQVGVVLGTAAYMSPEQARGHAADPRSDIWTFGAVLFEMLAGRPAFQGDSVSDVLAAVIAEEPRWIDLPTHTPAGVRTLLRRCLTRDPRRRLQSIGDARIEIEETSRDPSPPPAPTRSRGRRTALLSGGIALLAVGASIGAWLRASAPQQPRVTRFTITPPSLITNTGDRAMAIAPDGSSVAYVDSGRLVLRPMEALEGVPLTESRPGLRGPFFSPDGHWLGFVIQSGDGLSLAKVSATGGPAVNLCKLDGTPRGAAWRTDGSIVFATANPATGLWRVSDAGGVPTQLTTPDTAQGELDHQWPEILPDGRSVIFTITPASRAIGDTSVAVLDARTGARKILARGGSHAHYVPSGHLVYAVGNTLWAVAFDVGRLATSGSPVPVPPDLTTLSNGPSYFDVARDGSLVYALRRSYKEARRLIWVDRLGREHPINAPPRAYRHPRISPDGTRLAIDASDDKEDIWLWDFARERLTPLTFEASVERLPVWTPDGRHVVFQSSRGGAWNVYWQRADGSGSIERLSEGPTDHAPTAAVPDGTHLVITESGSATPDLMLLRLPSAPPPFGRHGDAVAPRRPPNTTSVANDSWPRPLKPLLQQPDNDQAGEISPDGRWLAYVLYKLGQGEIFVRSFPDVTNGHWQVSTGGGKGPLWSRDGRELFYADASGALVGVRVAKGGGWSASAPTPILPPRYLVGLAQRRTYDISPDGQRFLMVTNEGGATDPDLLTLIVVQHWSEELARRVPASPSAR